MLQDPWLKAGTWDVSEDDVIEKLNFEAFEPSTSISLDSGSEFLNRSSAGPRLLILDIFGDLKLLFLQINTKV